MCAINVLLVAYVLLQPSVRKTHNSGRKHKESVKLYYMNWLEQEAQHMMEQPGTVRLDVLAIVNHDRSILA